MYVNRSAMIERIRYWRLEVSVQSQSPSIADHLHHSVALPELRPLANIWYICRDIKQKSINSRQFQERDLSLMIVS